MRYHNKNPKYYTKTKTEGSQTTPTNISKPLDTEEHLDTEKPFSILDSFPTQITQVFDKASETYYVPMGKCIPCNVIVTCISITMVITVINTITLCFLGPILHITKNQLKRIMEKKSSKREAPEKELITAALRSHKRETSRSLAHREKIYKTYPTKGL